MTMKLTLDSKEHELPFFPAPPADQTLQPADALLRESTAGQSQYSPETQYEEIARAMARYGHYPACIDGDERRGHVSTRRGYQNIRSRVEAGLTTAVYVIHSSRLGRDADERMKLARELRKLKVPIYSCQQGEIQAGLVGGVYALMDEQFSVDLAAKIVLAMPKAVKNGLYPARTPVGYKRIWPQKDGEDAQYERKSRPKMVIDDHYGPLVRTIFRRYGTEGWSMRAIVRWLNSPEVLATHPNPEGKTGQWNRPTISRMLRKPVYIGQIVWGQTKYGHYDHYDGPVLRSGEGECGPARHEALIERAVWEAVQMRLSADEKRLQTHTRTGRVPCLLSGFLVCAGCGQPMRGSRERPTRRATGAYICAQQDSCLGSCREPRVAMSVAHPAVLREVARLRPTQPYAPLGSGALEELAGHDRHARERADLAAAIAAAQREHARNIKLLKLVDDPDEGTIATFRRDNRALHDQITALEAQLAALPRSTVDPGRIEEVLRRLARSDVAGKIARAEADGDVAALRELLGWTVQKAWITERHGGGRNGKTNWARAQVEWTPDVDLLLQYGYLELAPAAEPPAVPNPAARERMRRYRARRRAGLVGQDDSAQRAAELEQAGLLTVPAAAAELGITAAAVRRAIMRGAITPVRAEGRRQNLLRRSEVERYRAEHLGRRGRRPT